MNADTKGNKGQDDQDFQNENTGNKGQQKASSPAAHHFTDNAQPDYADDLTGNPYDSENLDQESDSESKDITEKDIEKDLIENDPSEGFETDIDTQKGEADESASFETIAPEKDNPVNREFEIGQLKNEELREDERTRDETGNAAPGHDKPSQRKF